jgi:hypothetical protein
LCLFLLPFLRTPLLAQDLDLSWHTVDGGGAMFSTGGTYSLGGTIGQADSGSFSAPMAGGTYQLVGGFWPGATPSVCACPGDLNGDAMRNGGDVQQFVTCVVSGGSCGCADINGFGGVDMADVTLFTNQLLTGTGCP